MSQSLVATVTKLEARATKLRELVDEAAHPAVSLAVQRAYASLRGCAELAAHLETAATERARTVIDTAKDRASDGAAIGAVLTIQATVVAFDRLLTSGALLSQGRDAEAVKQLGEHLFGLALKIGAKLSGVEYVKDLAELIEALRELLKTGEIVKLRRQQVRMASDLLMWLDAVTLVALTWGFAAQHFLLAAEGKGGASDDDVIDLVLARMATCSY